MRIIFNFGDEPEGEQPGKRITFGKLDFIADQFGDLCLQVPGLTEGGEQSLQIRAFAAELGEATDTGPDTLARYLKRYAHLFVEDGREGEPVPTFYISKTTDFNSASDPILIPRHPGLRQDRGGRRPPVPRHSHRLW